MTLTAAGLPGAQLPPDVSAIPVEAGGEIERFDRQLAAPQPHRPAARGLTNELE